jgi:carboxylesterase type B
MLRYPSRPLPFLGDNVIRSRQSTTDISGAAPVPAAIGDCKCGIRVVRANAAKYNGHPAKIGLVGSSAGAPLSLLARTPDKPRTRRLRRLSRRIPAVCRRPA